MKNSKFSFLILFSIFGCSEPENQKKQDVFANLGDRNISLGSSIEYNENIKEFPLPDDISNDFNSFNTTDLNLPLPSDIKSPELRDGLVKEYFDDGSIKEEVQFVRGIKEGTRKIWYPSGQIAKSGSMKNDRWHGSYEEWYESGKPKLCGKYIDGKQDGEWLFFDKDGNELPILFFEDGKETTRKLPSLLND